MKYLALCLAALLAACSSPVTQPKSPPVTPVAPFTLSDLDVLMYYYSPADSGWYGADYLPATIRRDGSVVSFWLVREQRNLTLYNIHLDTAIFVVSHCADKIEDLWTAFFKEGPVINFETLPPAFTVGQTHDVDGWYTFPDGEPKDTHSVQFLAFQATRYLCRAGR